MGLLMEGRLGGIVALAAPAICLAHAAPIVSGALAVAAAACGARYVYLLAKTLKAAVFGPLLMASMSRVAVNRDLTSEEFFRVDGAPEDVAAKREKAFRALEAAWKAKWAKSDETRKYLRKHFSDLRFKASGFESIHPIFQKVLNDALDPIGIVASTKGNELTDVEGYKFLDVSGSYGVNCFGYEKFKEFLKAGEDYAHKLGPCLGPMHPVVKENIEMLLKIFRKEEVSFHMSGTEAVMSAVYQARFHSQRRLTAVFQGTYHGWWDGVMQGAGNDRFASDCIILKDQSLDSLELIRARANEFACVIVNPISGFGWKNATTSKLGHAKVTAGEECIEKYRIWLQKVRETCTQNNVTLIYDEVWAFQLGVGGAQDLYGVDADLLVMGKSLGGGHATGCVLGPSRLMERRDPHRPIRVNYVIGTFKGNPMVMGSMNAVLKYVQTPEAAQSFQSLKDRVAAWVKSCNETLSKKNLPISVAGYRSTWCICYHQPSAYQFLFQYYLRNEGLQLVWAGTSKMLFNLEFTDEEFRRLTDILVKAATAFQADGWWWEGGKPVSLMPYVLMPTLKYHCAALFGGSPAS